MVKKSFRGGLDGLLKVKEDEAPIAAAPSSNRPKRGRPRTNFRDIAKSSEEGCKEEETRATFIVNEQSLEKIKAVAYWERQSIKDVIAEALRVYIQEYEQRTGPIKSIPKGK
jgi:hypothetical protein